MKTPDLICNEESLELKWLSRKELETIEIVEVHKHMLKDYFGETDQGRL